jgi:hypothetical protein
MAVPYTFGTATAAIPLSQLDSNFATTITLGNTAVQLGNTVTTLNNMTLANVTVSSGSVTLTNIAVTTANVTTANIGTAVITGTSTLTGLTASTALALDASKNIVSVTNTGSGNNVLGTSPTIATPTINTITSAASTALTLQSNNGNTAVTVDTSQNVGIGTTSPSYKLDITGSTARIYNDSAKLLLQRPSNSRSGSISITNASGGIQYYAGLNGGGEASGIAHQFYSDVPSTLSPLMTILGGGDMMVGTTTANYSATQGFGVAAGTATYAFVSHASGTGSSSDYIAFSYAGSRIGNITQNGTTGVLYNLTSDYRLKDNPVALTGSKDFVMALQPKTWDWWDGSGKGVGFIAHEFMEVAKYSGFGEKDAVDADNKPIHQAIQPSSSEVMANLVAFIQEQQTLIVSLTARIAALEVK